MAELRLSTYGQFYTTAQGRPASPQSPIGSGHAMVGSGVSSYDFTDTYPIYSSDAEALEVSFSRSGNNGAFFQD